MINPKLMKKELTLKAVKQTCLKLHSWYATEAAGIRTPISRAPKSKLFSLHSSSRLHWAPLNCLAETTFIMKLCFLYFPFPSLWPTLPFHTVSCAGLQIPCNNNQDALMLRVGVEIRRTEISFTCYAERRSGASTTSGNTGRGPERLQTAPRSQVLVKAHVPARREAQRRLSFPDTLAAAGAQKKRLQSQ